MKDKEITEILKLENQLCFPLYAASRLITQGYHEPLKKIGITYPQYLVLMVLWANDGLNVKEIGKLLYLDSGTLTPVLKGLFEKGFVSRKRDLKDDRQVRNFLTPKGKKLKPKAAEMSYNLFCSSGLKIEEANLLRASVQALIVKLEVMLS